MFSCIHVGLRGFLEIDDLFHTGIVGLITGGVDYEYLHHWKLILFQVYLFINILLVTHIGCLLLVLSGGCRCSLIISFVADGGMLVDLRRRSSLLVMILLSLSGTSPSRLVYLIKSHNLVVDCLDLVQDLLISAVCLLIAHILDDSLVDIDGFAFSEYLAELIDIIDKPVSIRVTWGATEDLFVSPIPARPLKDELYTY